MPSCLFLVFFGNEKSTDVLTTDGLCLRDPNRCRQARATVNKDLGNNVKLARYKIIKVEH